MNYSVTIEKGDYEPAQQTLVLLWEKHLEDIKDGLNLGFVTFTNKRPKNPKSEKRRIAGIAAKSISYLAGDRELVKMTDENFLYLMAKMGINVTIKEVTDE